MWSFYNTSGGIITGGVSSIAGTAAEITASAATGDVTLSLPAALTFTGKTVTGGTFASPTLSGTVVGTYTIGGTPTLSSNVIGSSAPSIGTSGGRVGTVFGTTLNFSSIAAGGHTIGGTAVARVLLSIPGTSTGTDEIIRVSHTLTADPDVNMTALNFAPTFIEANSGGAHDLLVGIHINPTITPGTVGVTSVQGLRVNVIAAATGTTTASGVYVLAPTGATNNYSLFVDSGSIKLDGSLFAEADGEGSAGEQLTSGGIGAVLTWTAASSLREYKTNIVERLSPEQSLALLLGTKIYDFNYQIPSYEIDVTKDDKGNRIENRRRVSRKPSTGDYKTTYAGMMGEEAPWAMHHNGRIFNPISFAGHTVLAIQALEKRVRVLEA